VSNWYQNNAPITALPIDDRAIHYGDGLFETVAIRAGEPRLWDLHMQRLRQGCARLGLPAPDEITLRNSLNFAVENSEIDASYALAKLIVSAGSAPRGYRRAEDAGGDPLIGVFAATPLPADLYKNGAITRQCATRLADQPQLAGLKTLNRLEQVLGRSEWQEPEIFEGLMCDSDDHIICGTMSNVFAINKQTISTPDLSRNGVAGVMRRHIIESLGRSGVTVTETRLSPQEVQDADALFLSNSQFGVIPVRQFGEHQYPGTAMHQQVADILLTSGIAEHGQ